MLKYSSPKNVSWLSRYIAYHLSVFNKQSLVTFGEHKKLIFQFGIKTRSLRTGTKNWKSMTTRTSDAWTRYNDRRWRSIADRSCVRLGPWFMDRGGFSLTFDWLFSMCGLTPSDIERIQSQRTQSKLPNLTIYDLLEEGFKTEPEKEPFIRHIKSEPDHYTHYTKHKHSDGLRQVSV